MNISNIASITGPILLTIAAFVDRASPKSFNKATNLFYTKAGVCQVVSITGTFVGTFKLTTGGGGTPVSLCTGTFFNTTYALYNTNSCTTAHRINVNML
jgi:hypothetical protein